MMFGQTLPRWIPPFGAVMLIILVSFSGGLAGCGMLTAPSPEELMREMQTKVKPGMSWTDVTDIRAPRKFELFSSTNMTGTLGESSFDADKIRELMQKGRTADGFAFNYNFSDSHRLQIMFDANGTVTSVNKLPGMKDLLEGNMWKN